MAKKGQVKKSEKPRAEPVKEEVNTVPDEELPQRSRQEIEQAFDASYLQQASKEFADDLDKLRRANDFKGDRSVQVLVAALRQGTSSFSEDEKRRVIGS